MSDRWTHSGRRQRKAKGAKSFLFGLTLGVIALEIFLLLIAILLIAPAMSERMVLKQLLITGNRFSESTDIKSTLSLNPGAPLMDLDLKKLEKKLLETRFIKSVEITRSVKPYGDVFDGTLRINVVEERIPVAKVHLFDRKYWLLSDGTLSAVFNTDASWRFDAARRSPEIYLYSVRQKDSPDILNGLLGVLSVLSKRAHGQIREIRFDDSSNAVLFNNSGFPLRLVTLDKPEISLANITDLLRMVESENGKYSEAILDPFGENTLRIKEIVKPSIVGAGVVTQ